MTKQVRMSKPFAAIRQSDGRYLDLGGALYKKGLDAQYGWGLWNHADYIPIVKTRIVPVKSYKDLAECHSGLAFFIDHLTNELIPEIITWINDPGMRHEDKRFHERSLFKVRKWANEKYRVMNVVVQTTVETEIVEVP